MSCGVLKCAAAAAYSAFCFSLLPSPPVLLFSSLLSRRERGSEANALNAATAIASCGGGTREGGRESGGGEALQLPKQHVHESRPPPRATPSLLRSWRLFLFAHCVIILRSLDSTRNSARR